MEIFIIIILPIIVGIISKKIEENQEKLNKIIENQEKNIKENKNVEEKK